MLQLMRNKKTVGRNTQSRMMMKAPPTAALIVTQADFLFEILVIALNSPAHLGLKDHSPQSHTFWQRGQPVFEWLFVALWPFDQ
jgi:hypothetical protein